MKKLLLLLAFCSTVLFSSSQFVVRNDSGETLTVGVQFTNTYGSCSPDYSFTSPPIPAFSSYTFAIPPGSMVLRVGYWGVSGTAWEYAVCGGCTMPSSPPGPFAFWGYTCSGVYIR